MRLAVDRSSVVLSGLAGGGEDASRQQRLIDVGRCAGGVERDRIESGFILVGGDECEFLVDVLSVDSQERNRLGVIGFEVLQQSVGCRGRVDDAVIAGDVRYSLRAARGFGREGCDLEIIDAGGKAHLSDRLPISAACKRILNAAILNIEFGYPTDATNLRHASSLLSLVRWLSIASTRWRTCRQNEGSKARFRCHGGQHRIRIGFRRCQACWIAIHRVASAMG